jgi:hypothetical protein
MNSVSFYQPPTATDSKRGPGSFPHSVRPTSVRLVSARSSQLNQWDLLLQQYNSTGNICTEAPITRRDDLGGGGSTPRGRGADRAGTVGSPLLLLSYLAVGGSAPVSGGLRVDHADDETDNESLPSLEEFLGRNKDGGKGVWQKRTIPKEKKKSAPCSIGL